MKNQNAVCTIAVFTILSYKL